MRIAKAIRMSRGPRARQACRSRAARGPTRRALRSSRQELADRRANALESVAREPKRAAAERRKARPVRVMGRASPAIRRQAYPRGRPRVRRSAPAPVGALLPHFFKGAEEDERGARPLPNGRAEHWLHRRTFGNESGARPGCALPLAPRSGQRVASAQREPGEGHPKKRAPPPPPPAAPPRAP